MTKNRPQVIKRIVPEKRSPKKEKSFFQHKTPGFLGVFFDRKSRVYKPVYKPVGEKNAVENQVVVVWRNPACA